MACITKPDLSSVQRQRQRYQQPSALSLGMACKLTGVWLKAGVTLLWPMECRTSDKLEAAIARQLFSVSQSLQHKNSQYACHVHVQLAKMLAQWTFLVAGLARATTIWHFHDIVARNAASRVAGCCFEPECFCRLPVQVFITIKEGSQTESWPASCSGCTSHLNYAWNVSVRCLLYSTADPGDDSPKDDVLSRIWV